jgi:bisphosphoglycerate-independent phosphoglycerate mutase (AlkP superfamily)
MGDTDEYGHRNDYRGYLRALTYADYVIGQVAAILSTYEAEGRRATLLVTTDHGRAENFIDHGAGAPESAAVWLVAAGWGIPPQGNVVPRERLFLADIAATIRRIGGLRDTEPTSHPIAEILHSDAARVALRE